MPSVVLFFLFTRTRPLEGIVLLVELPSVNRVLKSSRDKRSSRGASGEPWSLFRLHLAGNDVGFIGSGTRLKSQNLFVSVSRQSGRVVSGKTVISTERYDGSWRDIFVTAPATGPRSSRKKGDSRRSHYRRKAKIVVECRIFLWRDRRIFPTRVVIQRCFEIRHFLEWKRIFHFSEKQNFIFFVRV